MSRVGRRRGGVALLAFGSACIAALHVVHGLRADLAPWQHRLSEYANGVAGVVMTAAFAAIGAALLVLAPIVPPPRRPIRTALQVAGLGLLVSGAFRTGVAEAGATADAIHSIASSTATVAMIAAVVLSRRWRFAAVVAALGALSPLTHGTVVGGLGQRLLWATLLLWCVVATRVPRHGVSGTSAPARTIVA